MTNIQLQNVLSNFPNDCEINIEQCEIYENGKIINVRVDYEEDNNFEKPRLTIEYERGDRY